MPVKARVSKRRAWTITDEVLYALVTARDTDEVYISCIRGEGCFSTDRTLHCETCARHLEARRTLSRLLNLPPWRPDPGQISGPEEDPNVWAMLQEIERNLAARG